MHKDIVCHRCKKRIPDANEFSALEQKTKDLPLREKTKAEWAFKDATCQCPERATSRRPSSLFTSRPQPPNLDSIERKMK